MGMFSWLFGQRSLENPNVSLNDPRAWEETFGSKQTHAGVRVNHKTALGHAPLWRGVNLIAKTVGGLRPVVYKEEDVGRVKDKAHPAYQMLRWKANRFVTADTFITTLTYHAVFYGNGYALILRDRAGRLVPVSKGGGLIILSPTETCPVQVKGELFYRTLIGGKKEYIPAQDVLHIKGLSYDGLEGHGVIEVLANSLAPGIAARDFAARFFKQGAAASGILMIPGELKKEAQREAMRDFEQIVSGAKNQHRVGVLQGDVKWQPLSIDPAKSQMEAMQRFDLLVVANALGLPPHKLAGGQTTSYASLEQENQAFLDESLKPWLNAWESELADKLLTDREREQGSYIEFNLAALLKADLMTRYQVYAIGKQWGFLSTNMILAKENEPGIGPAGDVFWAPANMVPIDKLGVDIKPPEQVPDTPNPTGIHDVAPVREAAFDGLVERLLHLAGVEAERIQRAAKSERNFCQWLGEYYVERLPRYQEVLKPLVRVWAAAIHQRDDAAFVNGVAMELAAKVVEQTRGELLAAAGRCTQERLAEELASVAAKISAENLRGVVASVLGTK